MKQRKILLASILVVVFMLSTVVLGSCELINGVIGGGNNGDTNPPVTDGPGNGGDNNENPPVTDGPGNDDGGNEGGEGGGEVETDVPTLSELDAKFYNAANWVYMTNDNGASNDGGDIPYVMNDGSIKFHRLNQAIEYGDQTNTTISFMLKGTNDWSIWFNSSSKDNANNYSYRLVYAYGGVRLVLSSAPEQAAANVVGDLYQKGEWNRFDVVFSTEDGVCQIKLYINGKRATLEAGDNTAPQISVADNVLTHTQPMMFSTGNYICVKVWEAHNYVQIKPVAKAEEEDLPIIACIGASITEGAGAGNFYTESYPAQLQNALAGAYNVVNFGNSGKTVKPNLANKESWLDNYQWTGVQAIVPDIAILNIGTNDSKTHNNPTYDGFYADYKNLVDLLLEANPDMRIIVCTVPYAYSDIWGISNENINAIIAPVQREIAEEYDLDLVDLYVYSQNKSHLFPDGVHPNTKGYEMFVKILKKALLEGADALTEEFIDGINEEYSAKVPDAYVEINSVVIKDMTLTVTGETNDDGLKLYVGEDPTKADVYNSYNNITVGEDGSFSISFDLKTMPIGGWYNVRLYYTDGHYYTVSLNELTDGEGGTYGLWSKIPLENTQVEICSWDEGGIPTLSFAVTEYVKPSYTVTVTGGSIVAENGQILLTVTGTTTDSALTLIVGPADDAELYGHEITVAEDGSFTVTFDLATLAPPAEPWQNAKIMMSDGKLAVVPYDKLGVSVDNVFYSENKKVTIKTWGSENILSLSVENYDSSYTLTATEVKFENGKLVFSGTTTNVRTLTAYLYNSKEGIMDYKADAVLNDDGSFTVEIGLEQLTIADKEWYYLWTSVNGGDLTKVVYQSYDSSEVYMYGFRNYKWAYWEGIAISYEATGYPNGITNYSFGEVDGKPVFTIEGYLDDLTIAANTITLRLDKTGGTTQQLDVENLATEAGYFKFVYDLSDLYVSEETTQYKEKAYFVRIFVNGKKHSDINAKWAADQLFTPITVNGADYYLMRNNASAWYTLGIVKVEKAVPTPSVTYTGATLENGKMVLRGNSENVTSMSVSLYDKNDTSITVDSIKADAVISSDGSFVAEVDLASITTGRPWNWYFIMVSVNGADYVNIIVPYDGEETEVLTDGRTFEFIDWEGGNTAVQYK